MVTRRLVDEFLSQKRLGLVGASRDGRTGFGNYARQALAASGIAITLVHPEVDAIGGEPCVRRLADLAGKVDGVVLVTPPAASVSLVREAAEAGIKRVWLQQGAESPVVLEACAAHGIEPIHGECVLMFLHGTSFGHRLHRGLRGLVGANPR